VRQTDNPDQFSGEPETWTWNGSTWTRRHPRRSPPPRQDPGTAYDTARGEVVLFGGLGDKAFLSATWTWDGSEWTKAHPAQKPPGPRIHGHGL
jgi:hypothetical protein